MDKGSKVITQYYLLRQLELFFVGLKWPFYWPSAPFFILVLAAFGRRVYIFIRQKKIKSEDFIFISSLFLFLPYQFIKPSIEMMKYQHPAYVIFIFLIIKYMADSVFMPADKPLPDYNDKNRIAIAFLSCLVLGGAYYYSMGDYIMRLWEPLSLRFYIRYYLPMLVGIFIFWILFRKWRIGRIILFSLLAFILPISAGLDLNQTRAYTTSATWMNYGERGFREAVDYLRKNANPKILLIARKDICYYLNYRYDMDFPVYYTTTMIKEGNISKLDYTLSNIPIEYIVFDRISFLGRMKKEIIAVIDKYFFAEKHFGDFIILKNRRIAELEAR
jgi:hypothetical protein